MKRSERTKHFYRFEVIFASKKIILLKKYKVKELKSLAKIVRRNLNSVR